MSRRRRNRRRRDAIFRDSRVLNLRALVERRGTEQFISVRDTVYRQRVAAVSSFSPFIGKSPDGLSRLFRLRRERKTTDPRNPEPLSCPLR